MQPYNTKIDNPVIRIPIPGYSLTSQGREVTVVCRVVIRLPLVLSKDFLELVHE